MRHLIMTGNTLYMWRYFATKATIFLPIKLQTFRAFFAFTPTIPKTTRGIQAIAKSVYLDVEISLQDFNAIEVSLSKALLLQRKKEVQKNQDILDSLLKSFLPVIWNYQGSFRGLTRDTIQSYVPEGADDASIISLNIHLPQMIYQMLPQM